MLDKFVVSSDRTQIHYNLSGSGKTALLFAHGWLGNSSWWNAQRDYFAPQYQIVQLDLAGHGLSAKTRAEYTATRYAEDIAAVANDLRAEKTVLIGHSMSGAYVLEAFPMIKNVAALVVVDTLKDLDLIMEPAVAEQRFAIYRKDFKSAVETMLPKFLFAEGTPPAVKARLQNEFLQNDAEFAIQALAPLYKMNVRELAKKITVPVRGIQSEFTPMNLTNNRKYFRDFDYLGISGPGHYPMLEAPIEFNRALEQTLRNIGLAMA